jgi:hypothetical protein
VLTSTVSLVLIRRAFTLKTANLEVIEELFKMFLESSLAEPRVLAIHQGIMDKFTQIGRLDGVDDNLRLDMGGTERKEMARKLTNIIAKNLLD